MPDDDIISADAASDAAQTDSSSAQAVADAPTGDSAQASTSTGADSAKADAQPSADTGSLANANTDAQPTKQPQIPSGYVPQKDLDALKRMLAERQTHLQRYQAQLQQYQGIDPQAIAAWRKSKEEAEKAKLPVWSRNHPENASFGSLKARWHQANQTYARLANGKTQDEQAAIRQQVLADFSPEEQTRMREWSQHTRSFSERMAEDPEGTLAELIEKRVSNMLSQREQQMQRAHSAEQSVGQWFQDQANAPVVETQREWMAQALEQGAPWAIVRLEAENRHLRSQLGAGNAKVLSAEAKAQAVKGRAAIVRDPATTSIEDPYERAVRVAKERGIKPGGDGWMDIIASLNLK